MIGQYSKTKEKRNILCFVADSRAFCILFFAAFVLSCVIFAAPAHAADLTVKNVRFGVHKDKTRMVLDLNAITKFRAFVLDSPYRLVIDLPNFNWQAGAISKPPRSGVSSIRQGALQPGISRIVIDLDRPMLVKNAFNLRAGQGAPDRLVVDFAPVTRTKFLADKDKIIGLLDVDAAAASNASPSRSNVMTASKSLPSQDSSAQDAPKPQEKPAETAAAPSSVMANGDFTPAAKRAIAAGRPVRKPLPPANAAAIASAAATSAAPIPVMKKPLVVIDPGHGGVDPGAIGTNGIFEKHITLETAKQLKAALEATGRYRVALTRDRDIYLKLSQRVAIARKKGADLFVSIHADTIDRHNVRGASVYTLSEKASDKQTERLAASENKADLIGGVDLSTEDKQVTSILVDLTMRDTMNQSKFFANTVVKELQSDGVRTLERTHRYAGFAVLKAPDIPSMLIELGFLSNSQEASLLMQRSYRAKIVKALVSGIDAYFEKVRLNQKT